MPITIPGSKPGEQPQQQTLQIQVVNPNSGNSDKLLPLSLQHFGQVLHVAYNHQTADGLQLQVSLVICLEGPFLYLRVISFGVVADIGCRTGDYW